MVSHVDDREQYSDASLMLTNAISELVKSVDTRDFNKAFWRVQQASERCKRVRATIEIGQHERQERGGSRLEAQASVILT